MNIWNHNPATFEKMLAEQLRLLLGRIPWLSNVKVENNPADYNRAFDLLARFQVPKGPQIELWVDCRQDPRPSQFPYVAIDREFSEGNTKRVRVWVFAAPNISPRMAEICQSHGWSWFDLAGNCQIAVPGLFHLEYRGNPSIYPRPKPVANLSTPEAGRVIRVLLLPENAGRRWTQWEMRTHCQPNVSIGLVNKVVRHLRDEAFIEKAADGGFQLRDPLKLLFAWRDTYRFDRHERRGYFTLLQGKKLRDALFQLDAHAGGFAAYAAFSAAEFQAPHVRQPKTWLYVSGQEISRLEELAEARPVDSGENLVVLIPVDEGVFYQGDGGAMGDKRMACTNEVQTYVDLWHCGGRGKEAAEALLEQCLKPGWKARGLNV